MNETDRELLEWAAKAAGIPLRDLDDRFDCWDGDPVLIHRGWNPLTDDGDAFRLAVKLGIQVCWWPSLGYATAHYDYGSSKREEYGPDPYAATRRAIVWAAARIGKAMV